MRAILIEDYQLIGDAFESLLLVKFRKMALDISLDNCRNVESALRCIHRFRYQVILLDWWLGEAGGRKGGEHSIPLIRDSGCTTPIVVVSEDDSDATRERAEALGVAQFVRKSEGYEVLVKAVLDVATQSAQSPDGPAGDSTTPWQRSRPKADVDYARFTPRQVEVIAGMERGLSNKHIARELGISDQTVKAHVKAILQATGANTRGEAVYLVRSRGTGAV